MSEVQKKANELEWQMTNNQWPMANLKVPNGAAGELIDHWSLIIGHWSFAIANGKEKS